MEPIWTLFFGISNPQWKWRQIDSLLFITNDVQVYEYFFKIFIQTHLLVLFYPLFGSIGPNSWFR